MLSTKTITSTATHNKNKTKRLTHNKNKTAEAQLTDSFGEDACLGLAPHPGREQQKLHYKAAPELDGSTINVTSAAKAIRLLFTPGLGVVHKLHA